MNVESIDTVANLIGKYGVTVIGLIVVAWGLYRLIKRVLDKNDKREEELTQKFLDQNDKFSDIGKQFIDALNTFTKSSTELVESNRVLVNEIKTDITNINNNINDMQKDIGIVVDRLDRKGDIK